MLSGAGEEAKRGVEVLSVYKDHIENFQPARTAPVDESDKHWIEDMFLLTMKPVIYVCNVDDSSAVNGNQYVESFKSAFEG